MKKRIFDSAILGCILLLGWVSPLNASPPPMNADYVHLYAKSMMAEFDTDIWIYPDGRYEVAFLRSKINSPNRTYKGYRIGLFHSVIAMIESAHAWDITTKSLKAEIDAALASKGVISFGVTDCDHVFLKIKDGEKTLEADFYAADVYVGKFPSAKSVAVFSRIEHYIRGETEIGNRD